MTHPRNKFLIATTGNCHPERMVSRTLRNSQAKGLRLSLLVLLLATTNLQAQPARFNGQAAYTLTQQLLQVAPKRFNGSPGHLKAEEFIKQHFAPEVAKGHFETDTFTTNTPAGLQTMHNFIVRFPGKKDGVIVLASHYETNYPLRDLNFYGANDGAATTALLIEIGATLRAHPPEGYSVWLVFDDGEEAVKDWSNSDSLYGTRHLAAKWATDGTLAKIKAFIVADMCADKDLNIDRDDNSTPWLLDMLKVAAKDSGHSSYIFKHETGPRHHRHRLRPPHPGASRGQLPPHRAGHARQDQRPFPADLRRPLPRDDPLNRSTSLKTIAPEAQSRRQRRELIPIEIPNALFVAGLTMISMGALGLCIGLRHIRPRLGPAIKV